MMNRMRFSKGGVNLQQFAGNHINGSLCSISAEMQNIDFAKQKEFRSGKYIAEHKSPAAAAER